MMRIYLSFRHENEDVANGSRVLAPDGGTSGPDDAPETAAGVGAGVSPDSRGSVTAAG
jgi:hypothetical protein